MTPTHAVVDLDAFKYAAAYVGEKRTIVATHKTEGWSKPYKNRTEFYGHWKKKAGGDLKEINKGRDSPYLVEEFDIQDVQTPEPIDFVLYTAKQMVDKALIASNAKSYEAYLGEGESFRVELSTLVKYKGEREKTIKPLHLPAVTEYLKNKYKAEVIRGIEADDMINIRCYKQPNHFAIIEDKDAWGCPINVFDINRQERGIVNCNKLGHLFLDKKGDVRGEGRMHFYWQMISEDTVDCYKANCFSDIEWGKVSAYNTLVDCKTDSECWQAMVDTFKYLYPEPKIIQGWRGEDILIDWKYIMQEQFNMAHMLRSEDEGRTDINEVIARMKVIA